MVNLVICVTNTGYPKKKDVPKGVDGTWSWQCDHDHDTKEFRGWICKSVIQVLVDLETDTKQL